MLGKLSIYFDDPEHGWVGMTISYGDRVIHIIASFTPGDSFLDLTNTLHNLLLYELQAVVTWYEEPAETELRFSRSGDVIRLEVYEYADHHRDFGKGRRVLDLSGSYEEICIPFWRALRSLQGRFSAKELDARWHRPFPSQEIDMLTASIKEKKYSSATRS